MNRLFARRRRASDKRVDLRMVTRVPADIVCEDERLQRALVVDVSRQGLQLSVDARKAAFPLLPDGTVRLRIFDPFADAEQGRIDVVGDISYQRQLPGGEIRIGVRLRDSLGAAAVSGSAAHLAVPAEWEAQIQRLIEQIHLELPGAQSRAIAITSTIPGEGVTTIARWLSMTLARNANCRVLYLDADFGSRSPESAGEEPASGLVQIAKEGLPPDPVVRNTPLSNLDVLSSGRPEAESLVHLTEAELKLAMDRLRERYDFIVIDGAATSVSPFTFVLARNADGVYVVVSIGESERESVLQTVEQVGRYGGRLLGVVVNRKRPD